MDTTYNPAVKGIHKPRREDVHETSKTPKTSLPSFASVLPPLRFLSLFGLITTSPQCRGTVPALLSEAVCDEAAETVVTVTGGSFFVLLVSLWDPDEDEPGSVARG